MSKIVDIFLKQIYNIMFTTSTKYDINRTTYLAHFVLVLISKKIKSNYSNNINSKTNPKKKYMKAVKCNK